MNSDVLRPDEQPQSTGEAFSPQETLISAEDVEAQTHQVSDKADSELSSSTQPQETAESSPEVEELPILPLQGTVVYPLTVLPLSVGLPQSVQLVDDAVSQKRIIGLVAIAKEKEGEAETRGPDDVFRIGTMAVIHRMLRAPDGTMRIIVQGIERFTIQEFTQTEPYLKAKVVKRPDIAQPSLELEALMRNTVELFRRLVALVPNMPDELMVAAMNVEEPRQLPYLIATTLRMPVAEAQAILELDDVKDKLRKLSTILTRELEVLELGRKIQSEAQGQMERVQREYFLREQLKAIRKELGEEDEQAMEVEEYRKKIEAAGMPEEAEKEARRELDRLSKMPTAAAEYSVIKTYLDWLTSLPWQVTTEDNLSVERARQVLDEDHYDLKDVKERIIEYLAVRKLRA